MPTRLRLLIDECVPGPLAQLISTSSAVVYHEILNNDHPKGNSGFKDPDVVKYAKDKDLILLTVEGRLDEKSYPVCTHPGIIILAPGNKGLKEKKECFQKLVASGHRKLCKKAVVRVQQAGIEVLYREKGGELRKLPLKYSDQPQTLSVEDCGKN